MRRRGVLSALVVAASGCLGGGEFDVSPDGTADATRSPSATAATDGTTRTTARPDVRVEQFVATERCPASGDATVRIEDADVVVAGCVRGANACAVPALSAAAYDAAANALTVIVGIDASDGAGSDACADAFTALGYRVRVGLAEGPPSAVSVVHDDVDGHREVARRGDDATTRPSTYVG